MVATRLSVRVSITLRFCESSLVTYASSSPVDALLGSAEEAVSPRPPRAGRSLHPELMARRPIRHVVLSEA